MISNRPLRRIESEDNAVFKKLRKVLSGRGIRKQGSVLVSGPKTVRDVLGAFPDLCEAWISTDGHPPPPDALPRDAAWYLLSRGLFHAVDVSGTEAPLLLIRIPAVPAWAPADGLPAGCTLLIPFQDPDNVGAVIRSAIAFGVGTVILLAGSGNPYHPRALRASGGAVFRAALRTGPSIHDLPDDLPVVPLSAQGEDIDGFEFPDRFALLPGLEGPGLPERYRTRAVSIPISSDIESLNAAAATAVALHVWASHGRRARRDSRKEGAR